MNNSIISWLDFSDSDRRKMMEIVSLFKERDTRDELGLATIRDAFADLLFPGTSTIQTRAHYFLFVPWLYLRNEKRQIPSTRIVERMRRDEIYLIDALKKAGETDGVIGQISGAGLQRFPSSIYRNGLRRWGILKYPGTQDQYHRSLDAFYFRMKNRPEMDSSEMVEGVIANWDPNLPPMPNGFPANAVFTMSTEQAEYLRERLLLSCPDSLLAHIVAHCQPVNHIPFAWFHQQLTDFSSHLQDWVAHARFFSEALHGAALLYNLMLAEQSINQKLILEYQEKLHAWREELAARWPEWKKWDRNAFWMLVTAHGNIPVLTRRFVDAWLDRLIESADIRNPVGDQELRHQVYTREVYLKRNRSRLANPRHLELWSGAAGTGQLDFRWSNANRIANDILRGLQA